ncbi:MAG: MarR family winged helix-turn-helix transcriptional regulator [Gaiellaceae bacterium]
MLVFGGPSTLGQLARAEQVSAPTMSRLVRGLERDGLALRDADEQDGRLVLVRPTAKGRRILEQGRERRISELVRLLGELPASELATLGAAVEIVENVLKRPPSA